MREGGALLKKKSKNDLNRINIKSRRQVYGWLIGFNATWTRTVASHLREERWKGYCSLCGVFHVSPGSAVEELGDPSDAYIVQVGVSIRT